MEYNEEEQNSTGDRHRQFSTKGGDRMIREARLDDALGLAKLVEQVESESEFMLYDPGERKPTAEKQRNMIQALTKQDNATIFVVEEGEQLVGYLFAIGGNTKRTKHSAYLVIGILAAYRGKGIGTALFNELDHWARENTLHRLELTVVTKNNAGVSLYQNAGFEIEGMKKDSLFIDGMFVDEYYMGKIIN
ncbi:GNAT family N-acetyltransferase [Ornithinibacillus salinisoli]|uniref:GNAT family N-acetyltransferase n=1 Tax=Ornithinibacillus salinisoli TaxID=1848459 RepID=A0ABW4VXL6_9BACI